MNLRVPIPISGLIIARPAFGVAACTLSSVAHASFLPPEMMDTAATYVAWFVICVVPIAGIVLFWMVHVLPEKIAEKRHHPQKDAIHTLCLLSLVFGGLLWPIAWLWAYTKPAGYRLAYGTEKHDDYYHDLGERAQAGELLEHELAHLREELDAMAAKGSLTAELKVLRRDLAAAMPAPAAAVPTQTVPAAPGAAQATRTGSGAKAGGA
jgi:CBS domain containing-hemolysin-like protein